MTSSPRTLIATPLTSTVIEQPRQAPRSRFEAERAHHGVCRRRVVAPIPGPGRRSAAAACGADDSAGPDRTGDLQRDQVAADPAPSHDRGTHRPVERVPHTAPRHGDGDRAGPATSDPARSPTRRHPGDRAPRADDGIAARQRRPYRGATRAQPRHTGWRAGQQWHGPRGDGDAAVGSRRRPDPVNASSALRRFHRGSVFAVVPPGNTRAAATVRRNGMVGETRKHFGLILRVFRLRSADLDRAGPERPAPTHS